MDRQSNNRRSLAVGRTKSMPIQRIDANPLAASATIQAERFRRAMCLLRNQSQFVAIAPRHEFSNKQTPGRQAIHQQVRMGVAENVCGAILWPSVPPGPNDDVQRGAVFGAFVTIRRSVPRESWPHDVHGCIGRWDRGFCGGARSEGARMGLIERPCRGIFGRQERFLPAPRIRSRRADRGGFHDAAAPTARRRRELAGRALSVFDPANLGLIAVEKKSGRTATYLPGVFSSDVPWKFIRDSLIDKSGGDGQSGSGGAREDRVAAAWEFYAYGVAQKTCTLLDALFRLGPRLRDLFLTFFVASTDRLERDGHAGAIPHSVDRSGRVRAARSDDVRNASVLADAVSYAAESSAPAVRAEVRRIAKPRVRSFDRLEALTPQTLSFLLPLLGNPSQKNCLQENRIARRLWRGGRRFRTRGVGGGPRDRMQRDDPRGSRPVDRPNSKSIDRGSRRKHFSLELARSGGRRLGQRRSRKGTRRRCDVHPPVPRAGSEAKAKFRDERVGSRVRRAGGAASRCPLANERGGRSGQMPFEDGDRDVGALPKRLFGFSGSVRAARTSPVTF